MGPRFGLTNLPTKLRYLGKMPFERMTRHFGTTNTATMSIRCLRKTPGFEGFWFSCRTSSAETSLKQSSALSWQNRSDLRGLPDREITSPGWRAATQPRGRTQHFPRWHPMTAGASTRFGARSRFANFATSSLVSGEGAVTILMPFPPKENHRHGRERSMANGRPSVLRMPYRNTPGAGKAFPRTRPSWIDSPPICSPPFNGIPMTMFAPSCGR